MANSHSALAPVNFQPMVQDYLSSYLVATMISNTKWKSQLTDGQTIDWPFTTDMRSQAYTPGTDLTIDDNVATSDTMAINLSRAVSWTMDPNQQAQAADKGVVSKLARRAGYITAKQIDQSVLGDAVSSANGTVDGGTLTSSTIYTKLTDAQSTLDRAEGADGPLFVVMHPEGVSLLAQSEVANGFNVADSAIKNGFVGDSQAGFKVYKSNNLPVSQLLTLDTNPTATDTMAVFGVTFTFVANGTAASAGEISIGASAAATQAIIVDAINGTGTPGASTYIALSVKNRRKLQNSVAAASVFATNVSTITGFGRISGAESFTAGTNVFASETGSVLCGRLGAPSLAMQINPTLASAALPNRPMETNFALHTLYGRNVFERDKDRLVDLTFTF